MITYKTQFDKLTRAYIAGQVDPYSCSACFCGNLLNNHSFWIDGTSRNEVRNGGAIAISGEQGGFNLMYPGSVSKDAVKRAIRQVEEESEGTYTMFEIAQLEAVFLNTYRKYGGIPSYTAKGMRNANLWTKEDEKIYEEALFKAFEEALEFLKQIHISKGENVDETPTFVKRQHEYCI